MMDSTDRRRKASLKESERPRKMLKVEAEAEKDEEILLLKERVKELETSLEKRKKEIKRKEQNEGGEEEGIYIFKAYEMNLTSSG